VYRISQRESGSCTRIYCSFSRSTGIDKPVRVSACGIFEIPRVFLTTQEPLVETSLIRSVAMGCRTEQAEPSAVRAMPRGIGAPKIELPVGVERRNGADAADSARLRRLRPC
jgi:hypothetical protein